MSNPSDNFECDTCTYVQSIKRPTCEMCNTPNPNFVDHVYEEDVRMAAMLSNTQMGDPSVAECSNCDYININNTSGICDGCQKNLFYMPNFFPFPFQNNQADYFEGSQYDEELVHDDDDDVVTAQSSDKRDNKKATAVEKGLSDDDLVPYYNEYILFLKDQQQNKKSYKENELYHFLTKLFHSLEYRTDECDGQLKFDSCQICLESTSQMVTMKTCGHCVICKDDFHQYLSLRIRDDDILPWIPCPSEKCFIPCHVENIIEDGALSRDELLTFITKFMFKKLSRNSNFITCINCEKGGFLQIGPPKKQKVQCQICSKRQTIEKGTDGDLDVDFKKMIQSGALRECPTCRHLTFKEKGLCNIIECTKCGVWWNWRTREQGHSQRDLKQRARMNGTLWEPGELQYQQNLEHTNPTEFKALLERNGIKYDPNYVRGSFNDE